MVSESSSTPQTEAKAHFFEQTPKSLAAWCENRGMKPFRAQQILEWVYQKGIADPAEMSNLSKLDREILSREMVFLTGDVIQQQLASDGTLKLLVQWHDLETCSPTVMEGLEHATRQRASESSPLVVPPSKQPLSLNVLAQPSSEITNDPTRQTECVMIPTEDRRTACISSQVGCPVGCKFCASGLGGLDSNLSAGRIVEQVWLLRKALGTPSLRDGRLPESSGITAGAWTKPTATSNEPQQSAAETPASTPSIRNVEAPMSTGTADLREFPRITNVVFMGMGEPLSNLANVVPAIRTICSLWALGISARKVTVSTVGLPKAIERLSEQLELPVTLALSLHAPNDEIRRKLIPWAEYTTIADLLASCQKWFSKTGREITLEYTMLRGVNDQPQHARELAQIAKTLRANINLIRYNEVQGLPFQRPVDADVLAFQDFLRSKFINVHIRASRGRDIAAACGQLRHETGNKQRKHAARP